MQKVKIIVAMKQENISQTIIRLTAEGLRKEMGSGEADLALLDKIVGSVSAGGDAVEDSREV